MYPKNAASPERIAVGAIYLIADGTIQTTGASVRVMAQGGAAGAGAGTLACDTTSGIWHYTPTQAETNYTSFVVLVYKASCTSASVTVVTTESSTPGRVSLGLWLGTAPLALSSQQVQAVVPVTQKVDVETIKTQTVTCGAGVTVGAYVGGTGAAAVASTALSNATWTDAKAGYLDAEITSRQASVFTSSAQLVDDIWDEAYAGHAVGDVFGNLLIKIYDDTNELQGDLTDAGRLDLIFDSILTDTGTTLDAHLTDIKGTGFVKDTHSLVNIEGYVDLIDDGTSGLAKIASDVAAALVDTNELQTNQGNWLTATSVTLSDKTGFSLAAGGLDSVVVETGLNARQALSVISSGVAGVLAGAATTNITIAAAGVPATNRITATVDADGNRSAVTLAPPT